MAEKVKDPVCGMMVDKSRAVTLEKNGQVYYFCSERCKGQFQAQGGKAMAHERHGGHGAHAAHAGGHAGHHAHMVADFRRRFWVSLVLTLPVRHPVADDPGRGSG